MKICESLGSYAPVRCTEWGPTYALQHDLLKDQTNQDMSFFYLQADVKSWIGYIIYIFYAIFPIILFLKSGSINHSYLKNKYFNYLLIFIFIWSLPLFHVAEDWSRWFSIHFHLLVFTLFYLLNNRLIILDESESFKYVNNFFLRKKFKVYFIVLLFLYATSFHHHHFFFKDVKLELTYFKIYKKLKNRN